VLTFHVDRQHLPELLEALDVAVERFAGCPGFGGLLCLEHDGVRQQVMVISLWDADGLASTATEAEAARRHLAEATDLGVTSLQYEVLRHVAHTRGTAEVAERPLAAV